ncbi:HalOD1 output domain-containing protein [Halospeciosus flavus]|uniref:HalOD1 output domain-containing protein n=1 Tax=Halospeciosus flavus TaxID=3032283 RepID=A0ABD5YXQ0_9EURY
MHSPPSDSSGGSNDLLVEIIETLETCGLEDDAYQLHDYVDVEALEQLVASSDDDIAVQFTVEGIQLDVSPEGVDVVVEDQPDTCSK